MAKSSAAHASPPADASAPDDPKSAGGTKGTPENDRGERIRLGKRYPLWKPGGRPISGYLLGISGLRMAEGEVRETLVIRTDKTTDAYDWDPDKKEAFKRDSTKGEDIAIFLTAGLESLRGYATDPTGVHHVYVPVGKKLKLPKNRTFWQYISDDPEDTETLDISVKKYKRNASTQVARVVAKANESHETPASAADDVDGPNADFDEIPF